LASAHVRLTCAHEGVVARNSSFSVADANLRIQRDNISRNFLWSDNPRLLERFTQVEVVYAAVRPIAVRVKKREHASEVLPGNYDSILPRHSCTPLSV